MLMIWAMLHPSTAAVLEDFHRRRRWLLFLRGLAAMVLTFLTAMLLLAVLDAGCWLSDAWRGVLSMLGYLASATVGWLVGFRKFGETDYRAEARRIEAADPRLREDLLSAVELAMEKGSGTDSRDFREHLQRGISRRVDMLHMRKLLPFDRVRGPLLLAFAAIGTIGLLFAVPQLQIARRLARAAIPGISIERASLTQLAIVSPSPPSGIVAARDAVAVNVRVGGRPTDRVQLQWRVDGEQETRTIAMTSRQSSRRAEFSANLPVGDRSVSYRVLGGDAVSLWYTLDPVPRPAVRRFEKHYKFPNYTQLDAVTETSNDGDLTALAGTRATLTVEFDQDVRDAEIRFDSSDAAVRLAAVEGSASRFRTDINIRGTRRYQIDAVSLASGLDRPFGSMYSITAISDRPPVARWIHVDGDPQTLETQIVSPLDVVEMAAEVSDEMPMERVELEYKINEAALRSVARNEFPLRDRSTAQWAWDLNAIGRAPGDPPVLRGGDLVRARIAVVDRLGQRGESAFVDFLISDRGSEVVGYESTAMTAAIAERIAALAERSKDWFVAAAADESDQRIATLVADANAWAESAVATRELMHREISQSSHVTDANRTETFAKFLTQTSALMSDWIALAADGSPATEELRSRLMEAGRSVAEPAGEIAAATVSHRFLVATTSELTALHAVLEPLVKDHSPIPPERYGRYLDVIDAKLGAVDAAVDRFGDDLLRSTRKRVDRGLVDWIGRWRPRFRDLRERRSYDPRLADRNDVVRASELIEQFIAELKAKITADLYDNAIIREQTVALSNWRRRLETFGAVWRPIAQTSMDSSVRSQLSRSFADRVEATERTHRMKKEVDLRFAADLNLIQQASETVLDPDFEAIDGESVASIFSDVAAAMEVLESAAEIRAGRNEIRQLALRQNQPEAPAIRKLEHPLALEIFAASIEIPIGRFQARGVAEQDLDDLDRVRYDEGFESARQNLASRRYQFDDFVSAGKALGSIAKRIDDGLNRLKPIVARARQTLLRFVPTLPELARQTADRADVTRQKLNSETADPSDFDQQRQQLDRTAERTVRSLVDFANISDPLDPTQRQLMRDADAAIAKTQAARSRVQRAIQNATGGVDASRTAADEQLSAMAAHMRRIADHFEAAEAGRSLDESRSRLRGDDALGATDAMKRDQDRLNRLAELANSRPNELLERFEQRLEDSESMRAALDEIARRTAEEARRRMEAAARDQNELSQAIRRGDQGFFERKRRLAELISILTRDLTTIDGTLLQTADRALNWGNMKDAREPISAARDAMESVIETVGSVNDADATLDQMAAAVGSVRDQLRVAAEASQTIRVAAEPASQQDVHGSERSRKTQQRVVEQFQRKAASEEVRAKNSQRQDYSNMAREAARRAAGLDRQIESLQKRLGKLQQSAIERPTDGSVREQVTRIATRIEDVSRAREQTERTRQLAETAEADAREKARTMQRRKLESLERPNPAAELTLRMTGLVNERIKEADEAFANLQESMGFADQLSLDKTKAASLARRQKQITDQLDLAVEELRRSARHRSRSGQPDAAEPLESIAEQIESEAVPAANETSQSLSRDPVKNDSPAGDNERPSADADAAKSADRAAAEISRLAKVLANVISEASGQESGQPGIPPDASAQSAAQAMDELDQNGRQGESASQGGQSGEPGGSQSGENAPSAGQASPTIASAVRQGQQSAARDRAEAAGMIPDSDNVLPPDAPQPGAAAGANSTGQGMPGQPNDRASGALPDGSTSDGPDWGQLRDRSGAESSVGGIDPPPQYRSAIEAYFKTIGKQAGEQ